MLSILTCLRPCCDGLLSWIFAFPRPFPTTFYFSRFRISFCSIRSFCVSGKSPLLKINSISRPFTLSILTFCVCVAKYQFINCVFFSQSVVNLVAEATGLNTSLSFCHNVTLNPVLHASVSYVVVLLRVKVCQTWCLRGFFLQIFEVFVYFSCPFPFCVFLQ